MGSQGGTKKRLTPHSWKCRRKPSNRSGSFACCCLEQAQIVLLIILLVAIANTFAGMFIPPTEDKKSKGVFNYNGRTAFQNTFNLKRLFVVNRNNISIRLSPPLPHFSFKRKSSWRIFRLISEMAKPFSQCLRSSSLLRLVSSREPTSLETWRFWLVLNVLRQYTPAIRWLHL